MNFELAPTLNVATARRAFRHDSRVQLTSFLTPACAHVLAEHVRAREDWRLVFNSAQRVYEIDRAGQKLLSHDQREALNRSFAENARHGFQYCYESIRVPDDDEGRAATNTPLTAFAQFLSSPSVISLLQQITGFSDIAFADAQATRYESGHFLTAHDDAVLGKQRRAAYTFGLSDLWRAEWGGLLMFHDAAGDITRAMTPRFNAMTIFAVPQLHSVSEVSRSAAVPRNTITGWLRARDQHTD